VVTGAAAEVAFQGMANIRLGRVGVAVEQIHGGHHHTGGAEPALESVFFFKAFLNGMEITILGEPLYGDYFAAIDLGGQHGAGFGGLSVDQDVAGTAAAGVAADVGAGQLQVLAQEVDEQGPGLHFGFPGLTVYGYLNSYTHWFEI